MFIKRKRLNPDGGSGKEQDEREVNNPDLNEILDDIASTIKEAKTAKAKRQTKCGSCFNRGKKR